MPSVDQLILEAATGARELSRAELRQVLEHVAQAGFDPDSREGVRGRLAGATWRGAVLRAQDRLPPAELKYLWHVRERQEWPVGTTLHEYIESIRRIIVDPTSGVFLDRYQGALSLGILRESRELRGPGGFESVLVQYRVGLGHWTTAFQPEYGLRELEEPGWSDIRWLRRARLISG
ncbi:MAG: hypothetical protein HY690_09515 [Chloroflexi bacterium]|nr:hypothetical protein [Chloroflexota bacterium]